MAIVGNGTVGKTTLLMKFSKQDIRNEFIPSVLDLYTEEKNLTGTPYKITFCDTAGSSDYERIRPLAYEQANFVFVVYSCVNPPSFSSVTSTWLPEIGELAPTARLILVATKIDLRGDRETIAKLNEKYQKKPITEKEGRALAKQMHAVAFFETSSFTGSGVDDLFDFVYKFDLNAEEHHCAIF